MQLEHPAMGTPVSYRLAPPLLGEREHTSEVMLGLGYSAEELQAMAAEAAT